MNGEGNVVTAYIGPKSRSDEKRQDPSKRAAGDGEVIGLVTLENIHIGNTL